VALSYNNLGLILTELGRRQQAAAQYDQAIGLLEKVRLRAPQDGMVLSAFASSCNNLSQLWSDQELKTAISWSERAVEIQRTLVHAEPTNPAAQSALGLNCNNLATLYSKAHDHSHALLAYEEAAQLQRQLARREPFAVQHRCDLAVTLNNRGLTQYQLDLLADAVLSFQEASEIQAGLVQEFKGELSYISRLGGIYNNLAMVHQMQGDLEQAAIEYEQGIVQQSHAHQLAPQIVQYREYLSRNYFNYGRVLCRLNRPADAVRIARLRRKLWPRDPGQLYSVAEEITSAIRLVSNEDPRRQTWTEEVTESLRQAVDAGWKPRANQDGIISQTLGDEPSVAEILSRGPKT
jgi:tetratricopeptide (TPR) repeat protein